MGEAEVGDVDAVRLIEAARAAARNAYAPYSRFAVGAALLLADGTIVAGSNLESASYGLSLCAETAALAAANTAGRLSEIVAIAIIGGAMTPTGIASDAPVYPCGRCRQLLHEAARLGERDIDVICGSADGRAIRRHALGALLPYAFGPADLGIG